MLCSLLVIDCYGNKFVILNDEEFLQEAVNRYRLWSERASRGQEELAIPIHIVGRTPEPYNLQVEHVIESDAITSITIAEHRGPRKKTKAKAPEVAPTPN